MDRILKIALIMGALVFILIMVFMVILIKAEENCQQYKIICYRTEVTFLGHMHIETRCENNWDTQEIECIDKHYVWENLK